MAIERAFFTIKQDLLISASKLSDEGSQLLLKGNSDEAELKLGQATQILQRTRKVDELLTSTLEGLQVLGLEQPPVDYLDKQDKPRRSRRTASTDIPLAPTPPPAATHEPGQPREHEAPEGELGSAASAGGEIVFNPQGQGAPGAVEQSGSHVEQSSETGGQHEPAGSQQVESGRKMRDFSTLQKNTARSCLMLNPDGTSFQFPTLLSIAHEIYKDEFAKLSDAKDIKARELSLVPAVQSTREGAIKKLEQADKLQPEDLPQEIKDFLSWVKENPLYANLNTEQLAQVMRHKVKISDLQQGVNVTPAADEQVETLQPEVTSNVSSIALEAVETEGVVDPKFTQAEVYTLSRELTSIKPEDLEELRVALHPKDREELHLIMGRVAKIDPASREYAESKEALRKKLSTFLTDKKSVFMANIQDEDAQMLLTVLAGVESEEVINKLLAVQS